MRTLLADDNSEIRAALRLLLRELGEQEIVEAIDMAAALDLARGGPSSTEPVVDLVLLDWELPAGSHPCEERTAFVAALRKAAPGCRVIAMSAGPEAQAESLSAGCDAFVDRTDPPDRLVTLLARQGFWEEPPRPR